MNRISLILCVSLACPGLTPVETSANRISTEDAARADSLYRAAIENVGRVSVKESLKAFREALKVDRTDDFTYLQIELSQGPAGVHRLMVRLKDMNDGQSAMREVLLRVIE